MSEPDGLDIEMSGGCQCGAIRFHATELMGNPHLCHCRMCQKATGHLFAAAVGVRDEHLVWTRGTPALFESSGFVERGFCRDCGTSLFFHYKGAPYRTMSMGAFDEPARIPLFFEVGTEGKHPAFVGVHSINDLGSTETIDPAGAERIRLTNCQHPDHDTEVWPLPPNQ